jgi:hypothetical protein
VALSSSRSPALGTPDAALLAADQRAAEARAQCDAFRSSSAYDGNIPDRLLDAEQVELDFIHATPAATLAGAAVKLRALLEEQAILDTDDAFPGSLRQVLAVLEHELGRAAAA